MLASPAKGRSNDDCPAEGLSEEVMMSSGIIAVRIEYQEERDSGSQLGKSVLFGLTCFSFESQTMSQSFISSLHHFCSSEPRIRALKDSSERWREAW